MAAKEKDVVKKKPTKKELAYINEELEQMVKDFKSGELVTRLSVRMSKLRNKISANGHDEYVDKL